MVKLLKSQPSVLLLWGVILCCVHSSFSWDSDEMDDFFKDSGEVNIGRSIDIPSDSEHKNHVHSDMVREGAPPSAMSAGGMQGANNAGHGENCGPTGKTCWSQAELVCSKTDGTGLCVCKQGHIYVPATESCWVIPKSANEGCAHNIQCQSGTWGQQSWCSKQYAKCECYDHNTGGKRPMKEVGGVCYVQKAVGDLCNSDEECSKTIYGESYCQVGEYTGVGGQYKGACACREGYLNWSPLNACLKLATQPNDACKISEQCTKGTMLEHSRCTGQGVCQCYAERNQTEISTVYYKELQKCFIKKEYNDTCREENECKASLGPDVKCGTMEEQNQTEAPSIDARPRKYCYCPKGRVCRNSGFSMVHSASVVTPFLVILVPIASSGLMTR